ncbi:hypothetical protein [Streptomyces sp. NPDC048340]|uniref:hypothetical protein n=1 Tax=Streptomyces sp. NPDC048340 TaxID=3365537 RepID=UPI0037222760
MVLVAAMALMGVVPPMAPARAPAAPLAAPADAADPGRIAYIAEGLRHRIDTVGPRGELARLLPVGTAGNDCQPAARGDDLVWVSDRSGQGEGLYRRTGNGPAVRVFWQPGLRIANPVLSPDRQWIAFTAWEDDPGDGKPATRYRCDDREGRGEVPIGVWVVRTDGTGLRQVAEGAEDPDWSPDGTELVYSRGDAALRAPVAGGPAVRVSPAGVSALRPVWEPGGKDRIAYLTPYGNDGVTAYGVVTVPAGGRGQIPHTALARAEAGGGEERLDLAWRPDAGRLLALVGQPYLVDPAAPCAGCPGTPLYDPESVVPLDTHNVGWYTAPAANPQPLVAGEDWERIGIERQRAGLPLDRVLLRSVLGEEYYLADPAYAPDARRLAFVRVLGGASLTAVPGTAAKGPAAKGAAAGGKAAGGKVAAADGSDVQIMIGEPEALAGAQPLTYQGMDAYETQTRPAWSPDGTRLAFARQPAATEANPTPRTEIAVVDVSGRPADWKLLTTVRPRSQTGDDCGSDDREPSWSPDGTKLAFSRWSECVPQPTDPHLSAARPAAAAAPGPPRWYADRHIWTANASDGKGQFDVTGAQCGAACSVIDQRPVYDPRGGALAFVRQEHYVNNTVGAVRSADGAPGPAPAVNAVTRTVTGEPSIVLLAAPDGSNCRAIVPRQPGCADKIPDPPEGFGYQEPDNPAYSPGGHRLAVDVRRTGARQTDRRILVIDPDNDGGEDDHTELFPGTTGAGQSQPAWEPSADLHVTLTATEPTLLLGATGKLVLTLRNDGIAPSPATKVRFTLPPGLQAAGPPVPQQGSCTVQLACDLGVLPAGAATRVELPVKGAALGAHEARAAAETGLPDHRPADNQAASVVTVVVPDLAVTATATPPVLKINERTKVEFTVRNAGTAVAEDVLLKLTLPPGLTLLTGTACPAGGCALGSLEPGGEKTLTWEYTSPEGLSGTVEGKAVTTTRGGADGNPDNDRAAVDLTFVDPRRPDAAVTVTATPDHFRTGEQSTVVYKVTNLGDAPAKSVLLTTVLPAGMTVVSATPPCPAAGCALGDLAPGASVTVTRVVGSATPLSGNATGTAVTAGEDSNPTNNTASAPLVVEEAPPPPQVRLADPSVSVTAAPRTAYTGGRITAEVVVSNPGAVPATGLTLTLTVPPGLGLSSVSRPGCASAAGCPVADLGPGERTTVQLELAAGPALTGAITASVTTTGSDAVPGNNTAAAQVTVRQPALELSPPLGPPGSVPQARGSQFPPGVTVDLRWSRGVTVASAPVVVGADGTFSAPVLVLVQDTLGERNLAAAQADADRPLFSEVSAPYLVVPGVLQPDNFQWRR